MTGDPSASESGHQGSALTPPLPGVPSDNTTMSAILEALAAQGYDGSMLTAEGGRLRCTRCRKETAPEALRVDGIHRLEGASDPADECAIVAAQCPNCEAKVTIVLTYGPEASPEDAAVLAALT
jgi:hypothetical protein